MDYLPCQPNTYNNIAINYRQRSQTLQPIHRSGDAMAEKKFMLYKYFKSQMESALPMPVLEPEKANYANVPPETDDLLPLHQHHRQHSRPHQHVHSRSHSHHHYHTMRQVNDLNSYYNIVPLTTQGRSRHPSPINDARQSFHNHQVAQLDSITMLQVNNELFGNLDSPPPMPIPRRYTVIEKDQALYKIPFPHRRYIKSPFTDPISNMTLPSGSLVNVLGPSKEDRAKFTICSNVDHIDIPHQLTQPPYPHPSQWN